MRWEKQLKVLKMLWNILYKTIKKYCVSCKKNTVNNSSVVKKLGKIENSKILASTYDIWGKNKLTFIKNQEASTLLCKLVIRIPLGTIPLISDILF